MLFERIKSWFTRRPHYEPQKPMYWESSSFMRVLPSHGGTVNLDESAYEAIKNIEGVELVGRQLANENKEMVAFLRYDNRDYKVYLYADPWEWQDLFQCQRQFFRPGDMERIQQVKSALCIHMDFYKGHVQEDFKLQLKLAVALMPDMLALYDESAERLLNRVWVEQTAQSKAIPGLDAIYTIQAVGDGDQVWLHTHGLIRCGVTELEIIGSDRKHYEDHYALLAAYASRLIEDVNADTDDVVTLGQTIDNHTILATKRPWNESIKEYPAYVLGATKDRGNTHNTQFATIFLYGDEKDLENRRIRKVSDFNDILSKNPIYYYSLEETNRMKELAQERFAYVKQMLVEAKENPDNTKILVKIGIVANQDWEQEKPSDNREHLWFELNAIDEDTLTATASQDPFAISNLHEGDQGTYPISDVSDWVIYNTEKGRITPNTTYLLDV